MKKTLLFLTVLLFVGTSAFATVVNPIGGGNGSEDNLQNILNNITEGGVSSVDAFNDFLSDTSDSYWTMGGTGISSATMVIEIAGNSGSNTFGIYDSSDPTNKATVFSGAAADGAKATFTFGDYEGFNLLVTQSGTGPSNPSTDTYYNFGSQTIGFFLNGFYSDSALNPDSSDTDLVDHMVAYASSGDRVKLPGQTQYNPWLENEYILAFEDVVGGDFDYNDMVLMVESVAPVPEPGTLLLLGGGLVGLAYLRKRKKA